MSKWCNYHGQLINSCCWKVIVSRSLSAWNRSGSSTSVKCWAMIIWYLVLDCMFRTSSTLAASTSDSHNFFPTSFLKKKWQNELKGRLVRGIWRKKEKEVSKKVHVYHWKGYESSWVWPERGCRRQKVGGYESAVVTWEPLKEEFENFTLLIKGVYKRMGSIKFIKRRSSKV